MQNLHSSFQAVSSSIIGLNSSVQTTVQGMDTTVQGMGNSIQGIETSVQQTNELLQELLQKGLTCECGRQIINPLFNDQRRKHREQYQLGQNIFNLHQQLNFQSLFEIDKIRWLTDVKMMDDGRLVLCFPYEYIILICNTDGSQTNSISVQGEPWFVTAVINSTVAVLVKSIIQCIEIYDVTDKHKLKSISLPIMLCACGITMINNKLVVGGLGRLLIVDHQTGETIQTIETGCKPDRLHTSGDRIFFTDGSIWNKKRPLNWYNYIDNKIYTKKLSSYPTSITSLQDGSLYVRCDDGLIHHVSNDLKHMKKVKPNIKVLKGDSIVSYNTTQNKMVTLDGNILSIFQEKK
ncbi:uncharacterized protein LOC127715105 [Mytilus californianus]|uniref:uncharacterized protein LOC127715105 n=1 Tax=Mytilus californianus TaxID=6549 RepID=UPI0022465862|nr:uncharacterized protein LOC127715105 [Mytilus californianus]